LIHIGLAKKIADDLKGVSAYCNGNMQRVIEFIECEEKIAESKSPFYTLEDYINDRMNHDEKLDMLEMGILELEKFFLNEDDPLYIKYAYLNLIEVLSLLKEESIDLHNKPTEDSNVIKEN
jgi:hypothetical protein